MAPSVKYWSTFSVGTKFKPIIIKCVPFIPSAQDELLYQPKNLPVLFGITALFLTKVAFSKTFNQLVFFIDPNQICFHSQRLCTFLSLRFRPNNLGSLDQRFPNQPGRHGGEQIRIPPQSNCRMGILRQAVISADLHHDLTPSCGRHG